jgi:hypothetical protein
MERELAKNRDSFEKKEREKEDPRTAAQSKTCHEVMAANRLNQDRNYNLFRHLKPHINIIR